MTVFFFFPELPTPMYAWHRSHYINELSYRGITFDIFNPLLCENIAEANEKTIEIIRNGKYDLFFTCLCNERQIYVETLEEIKKLGVPTVSFRPDNLSIPINDRNLAPIFDLVWLTSPETKYLYDGWGVNSIVAPYAANPYTFTYTNSILKRRVCFIGNPHGSRVHLINFLSRSQISLDLFYGGKKNANDNHGQVIIPRYKFESLSTFQTIKSRMSNRVGRKLLIGALYEKLSRKETLIPNDYLKHFNSVPFEEMICNYNSYSLALTTTTYGKTEFLSRPAFCIHLRNFEVPMAGGIQLCRYSEQMESFFEDGKECVLYKSQEEMVDKAKYFLERASDSEILAMKKAAALRSRNEHTWYHRFSKVFNEIGIVI